MDPDEFREHVGRLRDAGQAEDAIELILRTSPYVTDLFPPFSSGAGDLVENLMDELRAQWIVS
jgi:hypothetical protein